MTSFEFIESPTLTQVSPSTQMPNEEEYRKLLFNCCIVEYCDLDSAGEIKTGHDVHPLIDGIETNQGALNKISTQ